MLRTRLPGTALVAALLAMPALAGCTGGDDPAPSAAETSESPSPTVHRATAPSRPDDGACYRLTYDDAVAPSVEAEPLPCRQQHNAQTFHVGSLDLAEAGHLLAVDSDRAREQVSTTCPRRFAAFVGGSAEQRRLSMLTASWFSPTLEQSDAGQAWFRCDVIATSAPQRLARLEGRLKGVLDSEGGRDRWGRCATAKPGTKGARHVVCSQKAATWQAVATVDVRPGKKGAYPGVKAARVAGDACEDRARNLADDPLTFRWGYEWPTREQWRAGRHYGFCWMPK